MSHLATAHSIVPGKRFVAAGLCAGLVLLWGIPGPSQARAAQGESSSQAEAQPQPQTQTQGKASNRRAIRIARQLAAKPEAKARGGHPTDTHLTPAKPVDAKADSGGQTGESKPLGSTTGPGNQSQGSDQSLGTGSGWVLNTLTALGVVIGLVFLIKWAYQKLGGAKAVAASSAVEVLCRTAVAPKNHVLLLRVGQRVLIVSDSSQGLRTLSEVDEPEEVASLLQAVTAERESSLTDNFNRLMSRYHHDQGQHPGPDQQSVPGHEGQMDRTQSEVSGLLGRVRSLGSAGKGGVS